jgi:hypothetical protein
MVTMGVALGALVLTSQSAWSRDEAPAQGKQSGMEPGKAGKVIRPGEIVRDPNNFYGQKVQVRAEVEEVYGPNLFALDEDAWFAGPDLLVVIPQGDGVSGSAIEDKIVTVSGTVQRFVEADFRRTYGWFRPTDQFIATFTDRPILIASSLKTADGRELLQDTTKK